MPSSLIIRSEDIVKQAALWQSDGHKVAFATVVKTWGSSPRPVGSQLVINDERKFAGSVSGGCIEGAVVTEAQKVIEGASPITMEFNVTDGEALNIGLTCGGSVSVFISTLNENGILQDLNTNLQNRQPLSTVTKLSTGQRSMVTAEGVSGPIDLSDALIKSARDAVTTRHCLTLTDNEEDYFIHSYAPAPRLFVVGAGHISQALAPMANLAGFDITIIDPRSAFATQDRFPNTRIANQWPDEFLGDHPPDTSTAVIALVHDPKIDDPALEVAIRSDAFYVGALGSTRTHANRIKRLITAGFTTDQIDRISAPIGLDLGGRKPPEIAVSILAEIVQFWNGKNTVIPTVKSHDL